MKNITTESILEKIKQVYGDRYDYSKVEYVNYKTKLTIICRKHGEFMVRNDHFLHGHGCPKCGSEECSKKCRGTKEEFIEKAKEVHGNKYDYSRVNYVNAKTKVCIICPEHGEFWQIPDSHLHGACCPKCSHRSYKYTKEEFVEKAKEVHGNKYDYSKVVYVNRKTPVCIICPEHGEFYQKPHQHLRGHGCPICNESHLETEIKNLLNKNGIKYEQQKRFPWLRDRYPMPLDFYLPEYNVAIECQGEQHFTDRYTFNANYGFEKRLEMDLLKHKLCNENGIKMLYYSSKYFVPKDWDKYDVICNKNKLLEEINTLA